MNDQHHTHYQNYAGGNRNYIFYAIALTILFGIVEAFSGWISGSLTLISDAGHMGIDAIALSLAALASWIARRPSTKKHTYGFGRAEVIVSWISSLFLIALMAKIFFEAINRIHTPQIVVGKPVIIVAFIGLAINILTAWVLSKSVKTQNIRAAFLHVLSDMLGSVAALASGIIIYFTKWYLIDPILSIFICVLMLIATIRLLRESLLILMEGTPPNININNVELEMRKIEGVNTVHDLHVWTLTSGTILLTAHVVVTDPKYWPGIIDDIRATLQKNFGINHTTLQIENHEI